MKELKEELIKKFKRECELLEEAEYYRDNGFEDHKQMWSDWAEYYRGRKNGLAEAILTLEEMEAE